MGYAFLYGVFGSLLGSNLGGFLYERMLKPVVGVPGTEGRTRLFWLLFAVLDIVACAGLFYFARSFGQDTPDTRARARRVMIGVYAGIVLLGLVFLAIGANATPVQYRTVVQAIIFIALGGGGIAVSLSRKSV
jgi:phosphoglycerol transferase MdoB-like AlkP superfamily enzyme